ncbi:GPP34 family phosphoprotein [Actinoplanes sp. NPDC048791]|uniref:GPP34 family phosphoprotein n=1 Tax=Actinoplanes sp. NPDC048791 TaxID=3154623 RepID=UPI0033EAFE7B
MPSAGPTRLTDDLWLAAHDSVNGTAQIGDWPLGVGLAAGLIAELIHDKLLELRQGELFRTTAELPVDPALRPLLAKMAAEEQSWPQTPQPSPLRIPTQTSRAARDDRGRSGPVSGEPDGPTPALDDYGWPTQTHDRRDLPALTHADHRRPAHAQTSDGRSWRPPAVREQHRHHQRGHQLRLWMSYLAYDSRAEARVLDRLSRTGLILRDERRRLFGGTTVRYLPYDSVISGSPANTISTAVQHGRPLNQTQLLLTGLFLATGLHHHALATLSPHERAVLAHALRGLDEQSRELLRAADAAVGEAAMR